MMKNLLLQLAQKNSIFRWAKHFYQSVRDAHYDRQRVRSKLVVFEAFRSTKYVDSPKAIYEYMLNNPLYSGYKFIWVFENPEKYAFLRNARTKIVKHESHAHYMAFARAKYWVVNGWLPLRFTKKPAQVMLQCWHGTPLKRLRHDIVDTVVTQHKSAAARDNDTDTKRFDYFVSPSKFASKVFTSAFNLVPLDKKDIIIETGYPRNDVLITFKEQDIDDIKRRYNIPKNKKVLLYAPTWRDDQLNEGGGYKYHSPVNFDHLQTQLSHEYVLLFRAHNLIANSFNFDKYNGFIYDVSGVDDVNDLYIISDVLMTDYSSVFFDYANLRRPIIFFMYDLDHYMKNLRGFYIDLKELPGDVVKTEEEIITILSNLPAYNKKHQTTYQTFHDTFNYLDDGQATKRVVERVMR